MYQPLADEIRPQSLDDVVGQKHILGPGGMLRRIAESGTIPNMIFYGLPGTGKTSVARILAEPSRDAILHVVHDTFGCPIDLGCLANS